MSMANWDTQEQWANDYAAYREERDEMERPPCQNCGQAEPHRDRMGFCPRCAEELRRELEEIEEHEPDELRYPEPPLRSLTQGYTR